MPHLLSGVVTALLMGLMLGSAAAHAHCEQQGGAHNGVPGQQQR
ncbi:MAG: hypothetical protein WBN89_11640 [Prochlorococcaceae cyanobacterium]